MSVSVGRGPNGSTRPGIVTSSTRPASPYSGQMIYETDTLLTLVWNGTSWGPVAGPVPWVAAPTFTNSWVNYGGTDQVAQYRKRNDVVELRGLVKNGTLALPAFTLPIGYRPPSSLWFAVVSNGAFGGLYINAGGDVYPYFGSNLWFGLNCSFSVTS